jgi:hypothetical protein
MNVGYTIHSGIKHSGHSHSHTGNMTLIKRDIPMSPPVIPNTTSGFTFTPLVSSSKNLNRPALEAGKGAFFFLLLIINQGYLQALNTFRSNNLSAC